VAIVQSLGALKSYGGEGLPAGVLHSASAGGAPWARLQTAYATIYATNPNVRTMVDFLSRNIAQLGIGVFRRVSDTDRERLYDHDVARWLAHPNSATTRYRLIESLIADLGIYFNAYWLKVRSQEQGRLRVRLVRLPPQQLTTYGGLLPRAFTWYGNAGGQQIDIVPADLVVFGGYNALDPIIGLSPLETLRRLLQEDYAAALYREAYWRNAGRMEGVIQRPKDAPRWTTEQKQAWRTQWQQRFAGPENAGMVPVLEDSMTWVNTSHSARDSEYLQARKLSREECASAYHIPPPMVGILDHATFSNIKEQHKQLYADTLGPWLEMVQEELEAQLLPESSDATDVYIEFNIAAKLAGSFEEQATALNLSIGRPFMTANEGRARLNLPSMKDDPSADQLAAQQGGPAASEPTLGPTHASVIDMMPYAVERVTREHLQRQRDRLARIPEAQRAEALNFPRCHRELVADLAHHLPPAQADSFATTVTATTYLLLERGGDPFAASRELPPCLNS
jgi:HK97 family phage portal protein